MEPLAYPGQVQHLQAEGGTRGATTADPEHEKPAKRRRRQPADRSTGSAQRKKPMRNPAQQVHHLCTPRIGSARSAQPRIWTCPTMPSYPARRRPCSQGVPHCLRPTSIRVTQHCPTPVANSPLRAWPCASAQRAHPGPSPTPMTSRRRQAARSVAQGGNSITWLWRSQPVPRTSPATRSQSSFWSSTSSSVPSSTFCSSGETSSGP